MADALFAPTIKLWLSTGLNLLTLDLRCILVDTALYTFDAAHDFLADVAAGAREAVSTQLQNPTLTVVVGGVVFDCDPITFLAVPAGPTIEALIVYRHTGVDATSELVLYSDSAPQLPFTPNGSDVTINWANTTNKVFGVGPTA